MQAWESVANAEPHGGISTNTWYCTLGLIVPGDLSGECITTGEYRI